MNLWQKVKNYYYDNYVDFKEIIMVVIFIIIFGVALFFLLGLLIRVRTQRLVLRDKYNMIDDEYKLKEQIKNGFSCCYLETCSICCSVGVAARCFEGENGIDVCYCKYNYNI
jgi:hypothetical protein